MGMYSLGTSVQTSQLIISWINSGLGGGGSLEPPSRYLLMISRARLRTCALSSSDMKPWTSLMNRPAGRRVPRINSASPVMCNNESIKVGMLTSSRALAIVASSSVMGRPACGLAGLAFESDMDKHYSRMARYIERHSSNSSKFTLDAVCGPRTRLVAGG